MSKNEKNYRESRETHRCPLCGYEFHLEEAEVCQECFFGKLCKLVMCPRCHYEFSKV